VSGPRLALAAALTLGLSAAGAAAPILDQQQPAIAVGSSLNQGNIHWQTFTAGITGRLDSVVINLWKFCDVPGACTVEDITVALVEAPGGVPGSTALASAVIPVASVADASAPFPVDLSHTGLYVEAGTSYAIRVTGGGGGNGLDATVMGYLHDGASYAGGAFLVDENACDGVQPSETLYLPQGADAQFSTFVSQPACGDGILDPGEACEDGNTLSDDGCSATCQDEFCGDGVQQTDEGCDDGNTVSNDGCSATCQAESCGDDIVQTSEACDDGNTAAGDGCSAACALETAALVCQDAVAKAGIRYASTVLGALQKCRSKVEAGKLAIDPAACRAEPKAAAAIAKAGAKARAALAPPKKAKCTGTLLTAIRACAADVDGLIAADGASGCLLDVAESLETRYGY
jgi:cysteine-rich repeat protein